MFNLSDKIKQVKSKIKPVENDIILALIIVLVGLISFGLGRLSAIRENKTPIMIENLSVSSSLILSSSSSPATTSQNAQKVFVASKNGTKYYYAWCAGVTKIKEENKVWFAVKGEAEKAGYAPAANCKGL